MELSVGPARPEEMDTLRRLFCEIRKEEFSWIHPLRIRPDDFDAAVQGENILAARFAGETVGFVSFLEAEGFIHNLYVDKRFRRMHIGSALIDAVKEHAGCPLTLKCIRRNVGARVFYLKNGWTVAGEGVSENGPYYLLRYPAQDNDK